jgi:hypothetical protein
MLKEKAETNYRVESGAGSGWMKQCKSHRSLSDVKVLM